MLELTGDSRHADIIETVLYNSLLSAVSADGQRFCYANPRAWTGEADGPTKHHTGGVGRCTPATAARRKSRGRSPAWAAAPLPAPGEWNDRLYQPLRSRDLKPAATGTVDITLIPYFAWANRGLSGMEVWIPLAR